MNRLVKNLFISLFVFGVSAIGLSLAAGTSVAAHDGENHGNEVSQNEQQAGNYDYEAQQGDTYSQIARKAIQTYGIENKVNLSGAEIVFAETKMTIEAGSPVLNEGQKVSVSKEKVKSWVEAAQKLDDATEKLWNYYVQFVDFNTNAVGQKSAA